MTDAPGILHLLAFAAAPEGGNPAGVVLDAAALDDARMQRIAADLGYPETAFVTAREGRRLRVRYFSPGAEVPFCGHATVATAVALAEADGLGRYTFDTAAGQSRSARLATAPVASPPGSPAWSPPSSTSSRTSPTAC